MKDTAKLAILLALLFASTIPMMAFLVAELPHAYPYILQLLQGNAHISIDLRNDQFMIVSHIVMGLWSTSLSYMLVLLISMVVFCVSLAFIARRLYLMTSRRKPM